MRLRSDDSEGLLPYFLSGHSHMHNLRHKHTHRNTQTKEHCNDDERFLSYFFRRPGCPLTRSNLWRRSLCCRWWRRLCCWAVPDQRRRGGRLKKAVNALLLFLGFSCNPEFDFDFFDLCCFCFFDFVGGKVVSSSPNLDQQ